MVFNFRRRLLFQEIGCFIRLNSSSVSVCQRLADELEKEAHEKNRLKEKNIVLDAFTKGLISLVLSVTVLYFSVFVYVKMVE